MNSDQNFLYLLEEPTYETVNDDPGWLFWTLMGLAAIVGIVDSILFAMWLGS